MAPTPRASFAVVVLSFAACAAVLPGLRAQPAPPASRELVLHKWSGTLNVPDPVACAVDPQGRVYVAATTRRKVADLDIREHTMWIPDDVGLTSVAEKEAFLRRELASGKLRMPRGMLKDHNQDGSIDWKDLTVHTERIYQLRDTDGDGTADKMTVFAEGFNTVVTGIAAGVLYHDGWVYATIAPDLWRLKDTDDDGVADIREVVAHGFGVHLAYAGHDMHGLAVGPDGRIYWSIGDKGVNVTSKEGRQFLLPNEGAILRAEPDGSNFEVYARGLRNPQEPAFDVFGDWFAVDNDADMQGERERFVFVPEASDSGWRCNYQYMKEDSPWMREGLWKPHFAGQAAYLFPPLASYSDGPAGFKHDPGTALGDSQRGLFLLNEFPSGKMKGFRIEPVGASFKMVDARVLNDGIMGIGMSWHPDGSLMMVDWIGGYPLDELGALWRVDAKDGATNPVRRETHTLLKAGFETRGDAELVALLGHADQRVRQGAQLQLAKRGRGEALLAVARDPRSALLARVHALWGYGQLLRRDAADAHAVKALLQDPLEEIRRQAIRVLADGKRAKEYGPEIVPLLDDNSPRVRLQAGVAIGKLGERSAVARLLARAERDAVDPVLRHGIVAGLAGAATPAEVARLASHADVAVRLAAVVALRRQGAAEVAAFLSDRDPLVVDEAARAIHDDFSIPAALPALAALAERTPASEVASRRAINANLRLGTKPAAARLLALTLNEAASRAHREEALRALLAWANPPRLDRVDGWARALQPAGIADVLTPKLGALLGLGDTGLKTLAVEIMIAHRLRAAPDQIAGIVAEAGAPGELRAQALRLLAGEKSDNAATRRALEAALAKNAPAALHRAGLELLLPGNPERLVHEATGVLEQRGIAEQQHVIALLAQAASPAADQLLAGLGDKLVQGTCDPALQLDIIEALRAREAANPKLAASLKAYAASAAATKHAELLAGGDLANGREIVVNHLAANCMACHSLSPTGGSEVGPGLATIGAQRDRQYLLEALLNPSAQIATGYGIVNVTLKDRTEITGTLARENEQSVTVRMFDGTNKTIARTDIASQTPPVSIMPPMNGILQPREIRDAVEFLSSLKGSRRPPRVAERDEER